MTNTNAFPEPVNPPVQEPNFEGDKFVNPNSTFSTSLGDIWETAKAYYTSKREAAEPSSPIPVKAIDTDALMNNKEDAVYRINHSTILMKVDGKLILSDPVFSERASPVQWFGPKRFHKTPIKIQQLPQIDVVIISHDHYDHLDKHSIKQLANKVGHFLVPLKVGNLLTKWGVDKAKIIELDWWQETEINGITFTATPTQHFSGRGLFDRDKTLWASWVILGANSRLYFSGDSGYFPGFKEIGERYGPFDITMIETGAYNQNWETIHMMPKQSLQAHKDLKGIAMLPIHNSTFDLSLHDWHEPLERIHGLAKANDVYLLTPVFGEAVLINNKLGTEFGSINTWWRQVESEAKKIDNSNLKAIPAN